MFLAEILGMTPTDDRAGGANVPIRFAVGGCSLGSIVMAKSKKGVCAVQIGDDSEALVHDLHNRFPRARPIGGDAELQTLLAQVVGLIEAPDIGLDLPLDVRGTVFQQRVRVALRDIPAGRTVTYADIARAIGVPKAGRAVAGACMANALAVAIPCHPVVKTDGTLAGPLGDRAQARADRSRGQGGLNALRCGRLRGDRPGDAAEYPPLPSRFGRCLPDLKARPGVRSIRRDARVHCDSK